jgi:DNA-binding GntR family transcriptional regulator
MASQLVDRLREAIVSGQLEAGSKINLERARGTSRFDSETGATR